MNVRKNLRGGREARSFAERVVGVAFDDALVREHRAAVDVDAEKIATTSSAQGERGAGVVAEDVVADGQFHRRAHGATGGGHRGESFGRDAGFGERHVAEIFNDEAVRAAAFVGDGIGDSGANNFRHRCAMAR